jgi:hypothetical protein
MKFEYQGVTYRIRFKHEDFRQRVELKDPMTGKTRVIMLPPDKGQRIQAKTTCRIVEVQGVEADPGRPGKQREVWAEITYGESKCSRADNFNRAHGRWYALERALEEFVACAGGGREVDVEDARRFTRAARKAYYNATRWRPDGRDGVVAFRQPLELLPSYEVELM